jgi:hypothetical protein
MGEVGAADQWRAQLRDLSTAELLAIRLRDDPVGPCCICCRTASFCPPAAMRNVIPEIA